MIDYVVQFYDGRGRVTKRIRLVRASILTLLDDLAEFNSDRPDTDVRMTVDVIYRKAREDLPAVSFGSQHFSG